MDTLAQGQYEKLAAKLIALGLGAKKEIMTGSHGDRYSEIIYVVDDGSLNALTAEIFVSDARVMAAAMRLVRNHSHEAWCRLTRQMCEEYVSKNMTLTITATCVELLERLK